MSSARPPDGSALLECAPKLKPDVILPDIAMPLMNGFNAALRLMKIMPSVKLIFLTINEERNLVREALRLGGSAYLLKSSAASELFQAIREALRGRTYVTPQMGKDTNGRFYARLAARKHQTR